MEGNDTYIPPGSATESSDILWLSKVAIYPIWLDNCLVATIHYQWVSQRKNVLSETT